MFKLRCEQRVTQLNFFKKKLNVHHYNIKYIIFKRRFRFLSLKNEIITLNNKYEIIMLINIDNKKNLDVAVFY